MNHSSIMKAAAGVSAIFGLALLLAPNALVAMYGGNLMNNIGVYNSMLAGAYLLGIGVMNWMASKGSAAEARHVIAGTLVSMGLGLAVALLRQLTDSNIPPSAWLNVLIFAVFTALFGYLQFAPRASAAAA